MKKFLSIRSKITLFSTISILIGVSLILFVTLLFMLDSAMKTTQKEFYERGSKYAQMLESTLDRAFSYLNSVTSMLESQIENGETDRKRLQEYQLYTFASFPLAEGSAILIEPNAYDNKDSSYINSNYGTKTGRISYYFYRDNGKVMYSPTTDVDEKEFEAGYYITPKNNKKPSYSDPYLYKIAGEDVFMITASYPVITSDKILRGVITVDLFLETLYKQLNKEKIYNTGYISITDEVGTVIYSPVFDDIGKKSDDVNLSYKRPTDTDVVYSETKSRINNKKSLVATIPIKLSMSDDKYYVSVVTPNSEIVGVYTNNKKALIILIFMIFFIMIAIILIIRQAISCITKPLTELVTISEKISEGNFKFVLPKTSNDEVGILAGCFEKMTQTLNMLIDDIYNLSIMHEQGQMDYTLDATNYKGDYAKVIISVCQMTKSYSDMIYDVMDVMDNFANGMFDVSINKYSGQKAKLNDSMIELKNNLSKVLEQIKILGIAGSEGKLNERADEEAFKGKWSEIIILINSLLDTILAPIQESSLVLQDVSIGNFAVSMKGNYKGNFSDIKNSVNTTVYKTSICIREISSVLDLMSKKDLNIKVNGEFIGEFSLIKTSLENIILSFSNVLKDIYKICFEVNNATSQVSISAEKLANSTVSQARSIEIIKSNMLDIQVKSKQNEQLANKASILSIDANKEVEFSNTRMDEMLNSMSDIMASSDNISNIIGLIEEIAFQTNLLALNASMEAAKAGKFGYGFAVVAREVKNLATRSQKAAKQTKELIKDITEKVENGSDKASKTALALGQIVSSMSEVTSLIQNISGTSTLQAEAINHLTDDLTQIHFLVQDNSSIAEENSSISQILLEEVHSLKKLMDTFKI